MPYTAKTAAPVEEITEPKKELTIEEVRQRRIDIMFPLTGDESEGEEFEIVTVNGKATQIKKGEIVSVPWTTFEAIKHSEKYKDKNILA